MRWNEWLQVTLNTVPFTTGVLLVSGGENRVLEVMNDALAEQVLTGKENRKEMLGNPRQNVRPLRKSPAGGDGESKAKDLVQQEIQEQEVPQLHYLG